MHHTQLSSEVLQIVSCSPASTCDGLCKIRRIYCKPAETNAEQSLLSGWTGWPPLDAPPELAACSRFLQPVPSARSSWIDKPSNRGDGTRYQGNSPCLSSCFVSSMVQGCHTMGYIHKHTRLNSSATCCQSLSCSIKPQAACKQLWPPAATFPGESSVLCQPTEAELPLM